MRRAFTLIELLTIITIIAVMAAAGVVSVRAGQGAVRIKGATRDIFAYIRHARSSALLTQQPVVITYSNEHRDGEWCARVAVDGAKILDTSKVVTATTLDGECVTIGGAADAAAPDDALSGGGNTIEDVLFAPISDDVVTGVKIKVLRDDEELEPADSEASRPRISVFSNVDYLLGKFREAKSREATAEVPDSESAQSPAPADDDSQPPVSIVWEVNGRTEPHRVYVYPDGSKPEKGLCIKIDRFGAAKVLAGGEEE